MAFQTRLGSLMRHTFDVINPEQNYTSDRRFDRSLVITAVDCYNEILLHCWRGVWFWTACRVPLPLISFTQMLIRLKVVPQRPPILCWYLLYEGLNWGKRRDIPALNIYYVIIIIVRVAGGVVLTKWWRVRSGHRRISQRAAGYEREVLQSCSARHVSALTMICFTIWHLKITTD